MAEPKRTTGNVTRDGPFELSPEATQLGRRGKPSFYRQALADIAADHVAHGLWRGLRAFSSPDSAKVALSELRKRSKDEGPGRDVYAGFEFAIFVEHGEWVVSARFNS